MIKPTVTRTIKPLPFAELSPLEFEHMCLWLIEREGYLRPRHLGEAGGEDGRDIVAYKRTDNGEETWYFQCKRYKRISAATLKEEVDKYNRLAKSDPSKRPTGIVFITSAVVSARITDQVDAYCRKYGYDYDIWARTELDMRVKKYPDIVAEFFFDPSKVITLTALHQIPPPPPDFTGRKDQLEDLVAKLDAGRIPILGIQGTGGIGKTALALKLAEGLITRYSDAQFFLDLKGTSNHPLSATEAMAKVIRSYYPAEKVPENEAELNGLYMSVLHQQRALLVLDNASGAAQVEPLIPPQGCVMVVTSRQRFTLPGMFVVKLDMLPPKEARSLLMKIAPRVGNKADEIAKLCGYLPLALRLAASSLEECVDLTPSDYTQRLTDAKQRRALVDAPLRLSYRLLTPRMQKLWRTLAIFLGPFDVSAAAAVWADEKATSKEMLSRLVKFSLVEWNAATGRYHLHDLARLFAEHCLRKDEQVEVRNRHAAYYLDVLSTANDLFVKGREFLKRGLALFDLDWGNIQAAQSWVTGRADQDDTANLLTYSYPTKGAYLLDLRQHPRERLRWLDAAVTAARRVNNQPEEARHLGNMGLAYSYLGDQLSAFRFSKQSFRIWIQLNNRLGMSQTLGNMGLACAGRGKIRLAISFYERQLNLAQELENYIGVSNALCNIGLAHLNLGEPQRAVKFFKEDLRLARKFHNPHAEADTLNNLGKGYAALGKIELATAHYKKSALIARGIGDYRVEGNSLWNLSQMLDQSGNRALAITRATAALRLLKRVGDPAADEVRTRLALWHGSKPG